MCVGVKGQCVEALVVIHFLSFQNDWQKLSSLFLFHSFL